MCRLSFPEIFNTSFVKVKQTNKKQLVIVAKNYFFSIKNRNKNKAKTKSGGVMVPLKTLNTYLTSNKSSCCRINS